MPCSRRSFPGIRPGSTDSADAVVELRCASLPFIGWVADHYWFVVTDSAGCHRWEVWQTRNAGGISTGHVHCDLKGAGDAVGGGPSRVVSEWRGAEAASLAAILGEPGTYPYRDRYRLWPGPNSNTYVAWVLEKAGIQFGLGWRAHGARYRLRP